MATETATLGVGIIGTGRVSGGHAKAVKETEATRLVAAADVDQGRVEQFAEMNYCTPYTDYRELLKRDDIDFVIVALPHWLHYDATIAAAEAKKHIFIEKPMAMTLDECDRMTEAAEKNGVKIMVGHSEHYQAPNITARRILHSGQLGDIVFANDVWYKPFGLSMRPPWFLDRAQGGGMWLMNGAHMIDRTCYVLDTDVVAVKATIATRFHDIKTDDADMALLQLRNGNYATIVHAGYKDRGVGKCEVEITLTNGMIKFDSYSNMLQVDDNGQYKPIALERVNPFTAELHNLVGAIRGTEELKVTPEWGRHIMEVMYACEESSRTGKEVRVG
jgi:phthalate 4,5-cis-dihydrodiol dehydrogenase